jgi:hypothetical protein
VSRKRDIFLVMKSSMRDFRNVENIYSVTQLVESTC